MMEVLKRALFFMLLVLDAIILVAVIDMIVEVSGGRVEGEGLAQVIVYPSEEVQALLVIVLLLAISNIVTVLALLVGLAISHKKFNHW